jgi:hypothetical protein
MAEQAPDTTRRCRSFRWGRTVSKNRASSSCPTSTTSYYYARSTMRWTLTLVGSCTFGARDLKDLCIMTALNQGEPVVHEWALFSYRAEIPAMLCCLHGQLEHDSREGSRE